jgi:hypothetical protein
MIDDTTAKRLAGELMELVSTIRARPEDLGGRWISTGELAGLVGIARALVATPAECEANSK